MSIYLLPEGESIALPAMAPARKKAKNTESKPTRKKPAEKKAVARKSKSAKATRAPSVITRIKQPDHTTGSYGANSSINLYLNEIALHHIRHDLPFPP